MVPLRRPGRTLSRDLRSRLRRRFEEHRARRSRHRPTAARFERGFHPREKVAGLARQEARARVHQPTERTGDDEARLPASRSAQALDVTMARMLREADTFFLASGAPGSAHNRGCDVSHRGGRPGFVSGTEVDAFEGAQRLIRMQVDEALFRPGAFALRGQLLQVSPSLTGTGVW